MKKVFFTLEAGSKLQLVKGCPTDWNGDGHHNDDYNHDGHTDQDDHDYYDGYMDGYYSGDDHSGEDGHSDAWHEGQGDGRTDGNNDNTPGHEPGNNHENAPEIDFGQSYVCGGYN